MVLATTIATALCSAGPAVAQTGAVRSRRRASWYATSCAKSSGRWMSRRCAIVGREVANAVRGALADVPWRDLGCDVALADLRWREIAAAAGAVRIATSSAEQTHKETRTLALGPTGSLELRNIAGPITVTAGSGQDVTIEIVRVSRGRTEADAEAGLAAGHGRRRSPRRARHASTPGIRGARPPELSVTVGYTVTAPAGHARHGRAASRPTRPSRASRATSPWTSSREPSTIAGAAASRPPRRSPARSHH